MAKQDLGKILPTFNGIYNANIVYEKLCIVNYNGSVYVSKKDIPKGTDISNEEYWYLLIEKLKKGIDYFTEEDRKAIIDEVTKLAESDFNKYYDEKKKALDKVASDNTTAFLKIVKDNTTDFNSNVDTQTKAFDTHYDEKVKSFDENSDEQTTAYNTNANNKLNDYNENHASKMQELDDEAENKKEEYDSHVEQYINATDDLFGTLPTKNISGNYIKIDDSKDCRILALNISGGHKQVMSNGLNKINPAKLKRNMDINLTTGTEVTGGNRTVYTEFIEIEPEESYYFKRPFAQGAIALRYYDSEYNYLGSASKGTNESAIFIPTSDYATAKYIKFCDEANTALEGYMLVKSSVPIPYEPYTSEKVMPSYQNESAITLVNKITLHTFNKNILNGKSLNYSSNNISSDYDNGVLKFKGTISTNWANLTPSVKINAKAGRYVFRRKNTNYSLTLRLYANDLVKSFDYTLDNGQSSMNITTTVDFARYYLFTSQYTSGDKLDIEDMIQFEAINTDTNIVQAKNQDIVLNLKNQELFDTDSVIIDKNGNYRLEICHKKIVLDGVNKAFTFAQPINDKYMFKFTAPDKDSDVASGNTDIAISNYLKMVSGTATEALTNNTEGLWNKKGTNFYAILPFSTLESANNWLKTNNLVVYYRSETKEVIELGTLSELPKTYEGISYVYAETNVGNVKLNIKYVNDIQNSIEELTSDSVSIENSIKTIFAMTPDDKVYTVRFPLWATSQTCTGEKLDDNVGKYLTPATDTVREETNYGPAWESYDCNAYVDKNGVRHITALKGMSNYQDTGKVDVFCLFRTYYQKIWEEDGYLYISRTFLPKDGYTVVPQAINKDGTINPWFVIGKYAVGTVNGVLYSSKGLIPAHYVANSSYSNNISYNDCVTKMHKKGTYYSAGLMSDYMHILTTFYLKFATKNTQSIMAGNTSNNFQYQVSQAENNVKRVILTTSQANNFDIGVYVSIGDSTTNTNHDRVNGYMHNIAYNVKVTNKEVIDDTHTALILDCEPFTTTETTYVSTMHEVSGFSDYVLGRTGSITSNTNGRHGFVFDGIELGVGGYEVGGNAFMDIVDETGTREIYITNDASKLTTNVVTAKAVYNKCKYQPYPTILDGWKYITELKFDTENGIYVPTSCAESGSSPSTGYADGYIPGTSTSGQKEFLLLGYLYTGTSAGLSCLNGSSPVTNGNWTILARLSINGVRGELS